MTGILALTSAFWLGILTAISPCPLATNIAAVSFISRATGTPRKVLLSGFAYAAGRVAAYVLLAALLLSGLLASGTVARALQRYLSVALGPLLILIGVA